MTRIEKRHDCDGTLIWARGLARNIYKDKEVLNSTNGRFRIDGQSQLYHIMLPRHAANSIIGARSIAPSGEMLAVTESVDEMLQKLPPFRDWRFVMLTSGKSEGGLRELAHEISGDVLVEFISGD